MIHQLEELNKYMFTELNLESIRESIDLEPPTQPASLIVKTPSFSPVKKLLIRQKEVSAILKEELAQVQAFAPTPTSRAIIKKVKEEIIPRHKDKLFWCFYIIYKGEHEYEQHMKDNFITEKNFKIETAEKLKTMKDKFKQAKLRISEIEDELMNKPQITLKGLHALCLFYGVSVIYEFNKKYSEYLYNIEHEDAIEIISLKKREKGEGNEYVLKVFETDEGEDDKEKREKYIKNIRETYWHIENADKPLKVPSAYTIKELQVIGEKLHISLKTDLGKNKTKALLYEEILSKLY